MDRTTGIGNRKQSVSLPATHRVFQCLKNNLVKQLLKMIRAGIFLILRYSVAGLGEIVNNLMPFCRVLTSCIWDFLFNWPTRYGFWPMRAAD